MEMIWWALELIYIKCMILVVLIDIIAKTQQGVLAILQEKMKIHGEMWIQVIQEIYLHM